MVIGSALYRTRECADSLLWARQHLAEAPDGAVFLADKLTKARGRQGRVWDIYPGQLTLTIVLKAEELLELHKDELAIRLNQLTMALCVGICSSLEPYGAKLKWPNDFVINGKKLGGMLMQSVFLEGELQGCILGFSINVNNVFASYDPLFGRATSIAQEHGAEISIRELYKAMLISLDEVYALWKKGLWSKIYQDWRVRQVFIGKSITVHRHDGSVIEGIMQQVLPNGDILINVSGRQEVLSFHIVDFVA